jgi:hypothetical protein
MSDDVVETVIDAGASVISEHGSEVDADLTWDNVEEAAPSLEDIANLKEDGESKDEWDVLGEEDTSVEATDKSDDEVGESSDEVSDSSEEVKADSEQESSESTTEESGDKSLSLDEMDDEATISVKVDGELQEISIKDFKNGISGEKAIAQRFTEFDSKEKEFNRQMEGVNDYINDLGQTMQNVSMMEGVAKIADLAGIPDYQVREALIKELLPEIERRYSMDENELQLEYKSQENEYLKNKTESDNQTYKAEQAQRELQAEVDAIRETHNINDEEWNGAISALDKQLPQGEIITPKLAAEFVNYNRAESRAETLMNNFDPSYLSNEETMEAFIEVISDSPELSDEDFNDILKQTLGDAKKENAEAQVDKKVEAKAGVKKTQKVQVTEAEMEDILDWDDL